MPLTAAAFPTSPSHSSGSHPGCSAAEGCLPGCRRGWSREDAFCTGVTLQSIFWALQDMSYVLFFSSAEFINCNRFIASSFKYWRDFLTVASKKQMHGAAFSGWKFSCFQSHGILCFSSLRDFFMPRLSVHVLGAHVGEPCGWQGGNKSGQSFVS